MRNVAGDVHRVSSLTWSARHVLVCCSISSCATRLHMTFIRVIQRPLLTACTDKESLSGSFTAAALQPQQPLQPRGSGSR